MNNTVRSERMASVRLHSVLALNSTNRQRSKRPTTTVNQDYRPVKVVGQGAFGIVYAARTADNTTVAIKKVLQDPRYKNRELEIMQLMSHPNVVSLKDHFKTAGRKANEVYINLVMDHMPLSLHQFNLSFRKERKYTPLLYVKLFAFQLFAGLAHIHSLGVTHRDIKPQNVLVDPDSGDLKICDFGSAKQLLPDERSVSYIASRYYRAPELIFDCVHYTSAVDIWAAGCTIAEMVNSGMPLFQGDTSIDQIYEIAKVIGSPTDDDLKSFQHSQNLQVTIPADKSLAEVMPRHTPKDLLDLLAQIFVYNPGKRPTATECMQHPYFDDLLSSRITMPDGRLGPVLSRV